MTAALKDLSRVLCQSVSALIHSSSVTVYFSIRSRNSCLYFCRKAIKMAWKYDITFHTIKLENDGVNFEESLDPYSAFRKASEDSKVPDQPLWGLLVWQVVSIFILGLVLVCK